MYATHYKPGHLVPTILQHTDTAPCETDSEVTDVVRATL